MTTPIAEFMSHLAATRRLKRYFLFFMVTVYWGLEIHGRQLPSILRLSSLSWNELRAHRVRLLGIISSIPFRYFVIRVCLRSFGPLGSPLDYLSVKASSFSQQTYRQRKSKRLTCFIKVHSQSFCNIIIIIFILTTFTVFFFYR